MAKRHRKPTGSVGVSRGNPGPAEGLRLVYMDASELREHSENWRRHPEAQAGAVNALLSQVGWAGAALLNERRVEDGWPAEDAKPTMIDGHLRRKLALKRGDRVPVLVGRWTPEQERMILATLDPTASMAEADGEALKTLLAQVASEDEHVKALLAQLAQDGQDGMDAARLSLDDLAKEYGEPEDDLFHPVIRIQVTPETKARFDLLMSQTEGATEGERFATLLGKIPG